MQEVERILKIIQYRLKIKTYTIIENYNKILEEFKDLDIIIDTLVEKMLKSLNL